LTKRLGYVDFGSLPVTVQKRNFNKLEQTRNISTQFIIYRR